MSGNSFRHRLILVLLAAGFVVMLGASVYQRFNNPSLIVAGITPPPPREADADMDRIGALMREASQNPRDRNVLLNLVEKLMAIGQWQGAENFAQKALALDPPNEPNTRALYLLALIHYNKGQYEQAAELLEKLLAREENPTARYSLGILYLHFLNDKNRGVEELKKGLAIPDLTPALRAALQAELEKAAGRPDTAGSIDSSAEAPGQ